MHLAGGGRRRQLEQAATGRRPGPGRRSAERDSLIRAARLLGEGITALQQRRDVHDCPLGAARAAVPVQVLAAPPARPTASSLFAVKPLQMIAPFKDNMQRSAPGGPSPAAAAPPAARCAAAAPPQPTSTKQIPVHYKHLVLFQVEGWKSEGRNGGRECCEGDCGR